MDDFGIYAGWQNRHVLGGDFLASAREGFGGGEGERTRSGSECAIDSIAPGFGGRVKSQRAR